MAVNRIYADIKQLFNGVKTFVLDDEIAAGTGTLTVKSIQGAAVNQILFIRQPGSESAEIVLTHASTAPSGNTITLASNLVETHPRGTKVFVIGANQIRFYWAATEVDPNAGGSVAALAAAQNIDPTEIKNYYDDTTKTDGFFYYRFENSISSTLNLPYSDAQSYGLNFVGFEKNEAGYIMEKVRRRLNKQWSPEFTKQDALEEIQECLRNIQSRMKKFAEQLIPDYAIGYTSRGVYDFALPSDIYDDETIQSILQVRLGGTGNNRLLWRDEIEFDALMGDAVQTTVRTAPTPGDTSLLITNSYNFADEGTVNLYSGNVNDQITYTGVTRSATAGVLTGVPASGEGSIALAHAAGINVWQNHEEGRPEYFNVRNGRLRLWPLPTSVYINLGIYLDYYEETPTVDSEGDVIDIRRFDMVYYWLMWKARAAWFNKGKALLDDPDFALFNNALITAMKLANSNQKYKMRPKLNTITY